MFPKDFRRRDYLVLGVLAVLALFIWLRDTRWVADAADTLPLLIALPIYFWLTSPWLLREDYQAIGMNWIGATLFIFLMGILANLTWILAVGWCCLLWAFLRARLVPEQVTTHRKLMILPMMAFPWVILDAQMVGWWFRLSGAWTAAQCLKLLGYVVSHQGTFVYVGTTPISVEPACSGMNTLQAMLIAGTVLAFVCLGDRNRYWWNLPLLLALAWIANTIRIIGLSLATVFVSADFAMGAFHNWGGWFILTTMFLLCWALFAAQQPRITSSDSPSP